jgi:hypothetical protein
MLKLASVTGIFFAMLRLYQFKKDGGSFADQLDTYKSILGVGAVVALDKMKKSILKRME